MFEDDQRSVGTTGDDFSRESSAGDVFALISTAAGESASVEQFVQHALRIISKWTRAPYALISVRHGATNIEDHWHMGATGPGFWKDPVTQILNESLGSDSQIVRVYRAKSGSEQVATIALPLVEGDGPSLGCLAMVVESADAATLRVRLAEIRSLISFIAHLLGFVGKRLRMQDRDREIDLLSNGTPLERIAAYSTPQELMFAITNNLRNRLGCDQVVLARVRRNKARIESVSGFDDVKARSPGIMLIRAAMEEVVDAGQAIIVQKGGKWSTDRPEPDYRLHRAWHDKAGGAAVGSIPIMVGDACAAVLSIRAKAGDSLKNEDLDKIEEQVRPFISGLGLVERATRSFPVHCAHTVAAFADSLVRPGTLMRKVWVIIALALLTWICFGTMTYSLPVVCTVMPATTHLHVAPFNGVIEKSNVKVGDQVRAGEVLFEMDVTDLLLEQTYLETQSELCRIAHDDAIAKGDATQAELERVERQVFEVQLDIVRNKISRSRVRATIDGVVSQGDPLQYTGQMMMLGDTVLEVVPFEHWNVELEVRDRDLTNIALGLGGSISCTARPEERRSFNITRILPKSEVRPAGNVFLAQATLNEPATWMRPGMEGTARIDIGPRPVWWILTHRWVDSAHRWFRS
jgi:hypothetical protein